MKGKLSEKRIRRKSTKNIKNTNSTSRSTRNTGTKERLRRYATSRGRDGRKASEVCY